MKKKSHLSYILIITILFNLLNTTVFGATTQIISIKNINITLKINQKYSLPKTVMANMSDKTVKNIAVIWDIKTVDTSKVSVYKYKGTVKGYTPKVILVLKIISSKNTTLEPKPTFTADIDDLKATQEVVVKMNQIIKDIIKPGMTELEKEYTIYDYITSNVKYDWDTFNGIKITPNSYTEFGAIISKKAVCGGIAKAVYFLMKMVGIECRYVEGDLGLLGPHAWNLVKIGGKYYYIDATLDIQRINGRFSYNYFNMSTKDSEKSGHKVNEKYEVTKLPECDNNEFSFLRHNDYGKTSFIVYKTIRDKDTIYYINPDDNKRLYKAKNNNDKTCITTDPVNYFWISDKYIFYYLKVDGRNCVYAINKDGTNNHLYKNDMIIRQKEYSDYNIILYIINNSNTGNEDLYMSDLNLENNKLILENAEWKENCPLNYPYIIYSNSCYYGLIDQIYSYNINSEATKVLYSGERFCACTYNGYCYVISGTKICEISFDGSESNIIVDNSKLGESVLEKQTYLDSNTTEYYLKINGVSRRFQFIFDTKTQTEFEPLK